jgi:superoxide reductase
MKQDSRRNFLKNVAIGGAVASVSVITPSIALANERPLAYSKEHAGDYNGKIDSHSPVITVKGNIATVTTNHGMSAAHFIALHSLQGAAKYFGSKEFGSADMGEGKIAVSTYDIGDYKGPLKAISVCNLHDVWISENKV